jgi:hypothetical protein
VVPGIGIVFLTYEMLKAILHAPAVKDSRDGTREEKATCMAATAQEKAGPEEKAWRWHNGWWNRWKDKKKKGTMVALARRKNWWLPLWVEIDPPGGSATGN